MLPKFIKKLLNWTRGIRDSPIRKEHRENNLRSIKSRHLENLEGKVIRLEVSDLSGKREVEIKGERFRLIFEPRGEYGVGEKVLIKFIYSSEER